MNIFLGHKQVMTELVKFQIPHILKEKNSPQILFKFLIYG